MTEAQLQAAVVQLAKVLGWMVYHTHDSRKSEPGFPDLVLVHPAKRRLLFYELKSENGYLTAAQREWLNALNLAGAEALLYGPEDWRSGRIEEELK